MLTHDGDIRYLRISSVAEAVCVLIFTDIIWVADKQLRGSATANAVLPLEWNVIMRSTENKQ